MTREEAIRIFRKEIECLSHATCGDCKLEKVCDPAKTTPFDSEYIEAYGMAIKALSQEPCSNCCNGNQIEKAKLCQKSYLAGMEHKQEPTDTWSIKDVADTFKKHGLIREQEPYDAISREAVIMKCIKYADHEYNVQLKKEVSETRKHDAQVIIYVCDYFKTFVEKLPSVTQKSGKWILTIEDWNKWTCSNCGYVKRTDIHVNIGWKYCPNCGAKMESEEK